MKKGILIIFSIALIISINFNKAKAQASVTAHATAEVVQALTATETSELNFGRFSPETTGGAVKLTPNGVRTASGSVALSGGLHKSANFYLTGENNSTVSITLPSGSAILSNSGTGKTMEVKNWESIPAAGQAVGILNQGAMAVSVGATLIVGSIIDNPVGIYAGTYAITFGYN